ncbi:MAG: acyltransferase [Muribaculaceae bacterium]|nr:acyltransferase [Muribaculaceae bacterium]
MKRIVWVDYAKSLAIFGVALLHTCCDDRLDLMINSFIMPVFFIISGRLFSYTRNPDFGRFAWKRFRQLVVPYFWIGALSYVVWLVVLRHYGPDAEDQIAWYYPLVGQIAGIPRMLPHNVPLWSLLTFYVIEMLYYPLGRLRGGNLIAIGIGIVAMIAIFFLMEDRAGYVPFVICPSLVGLLYYGLGRLWRRYPAVDRIVMHPAAIVVLLIAFILSATSNGQTFYYICRYGDSPLLYLVASLSGSVLVVYASQLLGRLGDCRLIRFISVNTLLICGFHLLAYAFIKGVLLFGFGIEPALLTAGIARGLLLALSGVALTLPLCLIVDRWLPFLVDKRGA